MGCDNATLLSLAGQDPTSVLVRQLCNETDTIMTLINDMTTTVTDAADLGLSLKNAVDGSYLLISGFLVFMMQAGFAMLCAGSVRSKNTMNILIKNVLDVAVGCLGWWMLGYGFAWGNRLSKARKFIGDGQHLTTNVGKTFPETDDNLSASHSWQHWFFQWTFAAAAATIVSGSVAERTSFAAYMGYSLFLTTFVYPVIVHWMWSYEGWLSAWYIPSEDRYYGVGMVDFAGSGVVHMVGGFGGLMGAYFVGPRTGRFDSEGKVRDMPGHSATLVVLGTFLLWFGWYGFNPGSTIGIVSGDYMEITARVAVTTTLSGAAAGVSALFFRFALTRTWDLLGVCNGALCGLVAITAGCSVLEPWAAVLCGLTAPPIFFGGEALLLKLKIDDPLSAFPMHGLCGMWGVWFVGWLASPTYMKQVYAIAADAARGDKDDYGLFYGSNGELLACQCLSIAVIIGWVCFWLGLFFALFSKLGLLRVPLEEELIGLDQSHHGGKAYNTTDEAISK